MTAHAALLVIDVQLGAFDGVRRRPIETPERFLSTLKRLIAAARHQHLPVIFVQDNGEPGGAFEPNTPHWAIHPHLAPLPTEPVIQKRKASAFHESSLPHLLKERHISELIICGLHSRSCVAQTALDGIRRGFSVRMVADGHAPAPERPAMTRAQLNDGFRAQGMDVLPSDAVIERMALR
ncbi:MAG: isochorismatase family protein [Myxococcota bacterium]